MLTNIWWQPKLTFLSSLMLPLSWLHSVILAIRWQLYQSQLLSSYRPSVPTIIVGNIIVGGAGKTPVTIALVEWLKSEGYRPAVISRGYGHHIKGDTPLEVRADYVGLTPDEPKLIALKTDVSVFCHPKRRLAAQAAERANADIIIADDGLQHYALARDIEIVIHPATINPFGNGRLLPAGPLREPSGRASCADFELRREYGEKPRDRSFGYHYHPTRLVNIATREVRAIEYLSGMRAIAAAGIAFPEQFYQQLSALGVILENTVSFPDHHHFELADIAHLSSTSEPVLVTEKDAVKIQYLYSTNQLDIHHIDKIWYLEMTADLPAAFLQQLKAKISATLDKKR